MGRPTVTRRYPPYFIHILDELKKDPESTQSFRFYDKKTAKSFQLNFLAFRNAAINEKWNMNPESVMHYPDLTQYSTQTRIVDGIYWVDIFHMDYTEVAKQIYAQLGAGSRESVNRQWDALSQIQLEDGSAID